MKVFNVNAVSLTVLFLSSSCIEEPTPCFEVDQRTVSPGEAVNFSNCSVFANEYEWDFGDGSTSFEKAPSHAYDSPGQYKVSLTATNNRNRSGTVAQNVFVKGRILRTLTIEALPDSNAGTPWDPASEADVQFLAGQDLNNPSIQTDINTDRQIPLPRAISFINDNLELPDQTWTWQIRDIDSNGNFDIMASGTFNPGTAGSNSLITISSGDATFSIEYQEF